jgi:hypothetical protein
VWNDPRVSETEGRACWSFPEGSVGHDESVKAANEEPQQAVDWAYVDRFERGMLGGGFVWPYTDV